MRTTTYHRQEISKRTDLRKEAVKKFLAGAAVGEIANEYGVSRQTVYNWAAAFRQDARNGLEHRPRGPRCALTDQQLKTLSKALSAKATRAGFPDDRWTLERITEFVSREFKVEYAPRSLFHVIKRIGSNPLRRGKPRKIADTTPAPKPTTQKKAPKAAKATKGRRKG